MPPSFPNRDEKLAGNWLEKKWLTGAISRFFELSKIALKWPPVSHNFYLAGVEPENLYHVTFGSNSELHSTLLTIYGKHGAIDLQVRGRDDEGKYYLKCSQFGRKHGPAKAVICVAPPKIEESSTTVANTEPSQTPVNWKVRDQEEWEDIQSGESEVEDDWVKV